MQTGVWFFEMLEDKEFPEKPYFINVDGYNSIMDIYPTSDIVNLVTGMNNPSLYRMNLLNMIIVCDSFETCSIDDMKPYI
jgi:hypothetical protein